MVTTVDKNVLFKEASGLTEVVHFYTDTLATPNVDWVIPLNQLDYHDIAALEAFEVAIGVFPRPDLTELDDASVYAHNNQSILETFGRKMIRLGTRPDVSTLDEDKENIYWDGTIWRHLYNDSAV